MSFSLARPLVRRLLRTTAIAAFALVLAGCGAPSAPGSSTGAQGTSGPSVGASTLPASPAVIASASAAAGLCLPAEIMAAIKEVARANFKPETPLNEVADALEALDYGGSAAAEIRDELVIELRDPAPDKTRQFLVHVANVFLDRGGVTEC